MSETIVVNMRHSKFDVRIDRRTIYGNRFVIGDDGNRDDVIRLHMDDWRRMLASPSTRETALNALRNLKGKRLGCWCAPAPCHGTNYVKLIAEFCL